MREVVAACGGIDVLLNTTAIFPSSPSGRIDDAAWAATSDINVTANHRLTEEAAVLRERDLETSIVLTSSANAAVATRGSEAYDVGKAALSHLVRELATSLAPGPEARCTTGHVFPVDGGLTDAVLR